MIMFERSTNGELANEMSDFEISDTDREVTELGRVSTDTTGGVFGIYWDGGNGRWMG